MFIESGKNGFLVPVNNKIEMANKLKKLIENENLQLSFSKEEIKINEKCNSKLIAEEWLKYVNGR